MEEHENFVYTVKIDNDVIANLLDSEDKRALVLYVYCLRMGMFTPCTPAKVNDMLEFFELEYQTNNMKSLKKSLAVLINSKLVDVYDDLEMTEVANIDKLRKNRTLYIKAHESKASDYFTLIQTDVLDKIIFNKYKNKEDMIAILALICQTTERKISVRPVTWFSMDNLIKQLHIAKDTFIKITGVMKLGEIIYFNKVRLRDNEGKLKEHNIYSLYKDLNSVEEAIELAAKIGSLNRSIKNINEVIGTDDSFLNNKNIGTLLDKIGYEINSNSVKTLSEYVDKHSLDSLVELLKYAVVMNATNPKNNATGFVISLLKQKENKNKFDKIVESKVRTERQLSNNVENMVIKEYDYIPKGGNHRNPNTKNTISSDESQEYKSNKELWEALF
ncbi:hypothetical protein [Trichococcus shcherbakoviae]|uniref:Uncharacterized protein n=1 Tax=Trichococcus shcherbakoviae subsp. psychrophilus TaxID=2585775 RepID=A0A5C5E6T1_9LACT|nr:hypothetical protein [Trichococcus shcherbakoviae]TNV68917.1 hypothetical protein FHK04_05180 [Trichococcus shcherbakoviae subsp. psychrophilus]